LYEHVFITDVTKPSAPFQDNSMIVDLTAALTKQGLSVFRFDFSGNG
jgi:alpha/beta superfamily hydrolase